MLGVFYIAGIHSSRIWTSGSSESVRWNACVHRLDLGLYSHPKEFWGNGSEPMLSSREKSPLPEAQRRFEPTTLHDAGQRAQHTTDWAIPVPHWFHCYKLSHRWPRVSESRQGKSRMSETYLAVRVREVEFRKTLATGVQQTAHSQRSIGTGKINFISSSLPGT